MIHIIRVVQVYVLEPCAGRHVVSVDRPRRVYALGECPPRFPVPSPLGEIEFGPCYLAQWHANNGDGGCEARAVVYIAGLDGPVINFLRRG